MALVTAADLARDLAGLIAPDQVCEVRALKVDGRGHPTHCGFYTGRHLDALARDALALSGRCRGVYWTVNPLAPSLLQRRRCYTGPAPAGLPSTDADVLSRRWLFVDIDPVRPADCPATDDERGRAWETLLAVRADLDAAGWPVPTVCDSGNGFYLLYPLGPEWLNIPGPESSAILRGCLSALAARHDSPAARIDTAVFNPGRIARLPGTLNRKGEPTPGRPHRYARILESPARPC